MSSILENDIKILWAKAAGRCSLCKKDLIHSPETQFGEMAHIIAKKKHGPRGLDTINAKELNKYSNLILLCPSDHTLVDKEPLKYSAELLLKLKKDHEDSIQALLKQNDFINVSQIFIEALKLLDENQTILNQFGPNSNVAKENPGSDAKKLWDIRKAGRIIPNNDNIISMFERHKILLNNQQYRIFTKFQEHAIAFKMNKVERLDGAATPTFPMEFRTMLERGISNE